MPSEPHRRYRRWPTPEIVVIGKHIHDSRIVRDDYTVEDVLTQIASALAADSVVVASRRMTALDAPKRRADGYGNWVRDRAILELTQRRPRAELFSVIPKGDANKPSDCEKEKGRSKAALNTSEHSPG